MELNIGMNIRRLRFAKGLTQEQLAELLSVSTAAVSKWESKNTYPDITMLFPLAEIFGVTVDELLGYDEVKAKADVDHILAEYDRLYLDGRFAEMHQIITDARKNYPHDYRIMNQYMWDKTLGNDDETLLKNKEELTQICDCILDGCTQDDLRVEATNMKAKLLHASGHTDEALALLSRLPVWYAPFAKEKLFHPQSAEYRYWNKWNCYLLMDAMSVKLARIICYDTTLSVAEIIERTEAIAEAFSEMSRTKDLEFFCIGEERIYANLAGRLTADNTTIENAICIREKHFSAVKKVMELADTEPVLKDRVQTVYHGDDMLTWWTTRLLNSPHPQFVGLRENAKYLDMLNRWAK